jgi:hypothetical protein
MENKELLYHIINEVEIEIINYKSDYVGIKKAKSTGYYYLNKVLHITYEGGSTGKSLKECKLILRPLSNLTTSHNIFEDKAICFIDESDNEGSFTIDDIYFKYKESSFSDWRSAYLLLLEHHFDVFESIEKGFAKNMNTLDKK